MTYFGILHWRFPRCDDGISWRLSAWMRRRWLHAMGNGACFWSRGRAFTHTNLCFYHCELNLSVHPLQPVFLAQLLMIHLHTAVIR